MGSLFQLCFRIGKATCQFRPKYRNKNGKLVASSVWWYKFIYATRSIRESAKTTRKTNAVEAEKRRRLELATRIAGLPVEPVSARISTVLDCTRAYTKAYEQGHRAKSIVWVAERVAHLDRLLNNVLLPDLTEDRVRQYMRTRKAERGQWPHYQHGSFDSRARHR